MEFQHSSSISIISNKTIADSEYYCLAQTKVLINVIELLYSNDVLKDTIYFTLEDFSHQNLLTDGKKKPFYLLQHQETIELEFHSYFFLENRLILSSYSTASLFHYKIYRIHNRLVEISTVLWPNSEILVVGLDNHIFWILDL